MSNPRLVDELDDPSFNGFTSLVTQAPVIDAGKLYQHILTLMNKQMPRVDLVPLNGTRLATSLLVKLVGRPLEQVTTYILPEDEVIQKITRNGYVGVETRIVVYYPLALTSDIEYCGPYRLSKNPVISKQFAQHHQTHSTSYDAVFIPCVKEDSFNAILSQLRVHGSSVYVDWRSSGLDDVFLNDNEVQHESTRKVQGLD